MIYYYYYYFNLGSGSLYPSVCHLLDLAFIWPSQFPLTVPQFFLRFCEDTHFLNKLLESSLNLVNGHRDCFKAVIIVLDNECGGTKLSLRLSSV